MVQPYQQLLVDLLNDLRIIHGWAQVGLSDPLTPPSQHNQMFIINEQSLMAAEKVLNYLTSPPPEA